MPLLGDLKTFVRYAGGLRAFLQDPLTSLDCRRIVEQQLRTREVSFLRMVERAVYANASSPYRALLQHRKIALEDVSRSLRQAGLEATLAWLYDEGIYVTLDQFKGRRPIERPGLGLPVRATDFDNPLLVHHYEASAGGSADRGRAPSSISTCSPTRRRTTGVFQGAFGLDDRPSAVWYPVPPAVAGMKQVLRCAKLGTPPERWFSQTRLVGGHGSVKHLAFTGYTVLAGRILGDRPLPTPDHTPLSQAARVAAWLARKAAAGRPAVLGTSPSSAVRACLSPRASAGSTLRARSSGWRASPTCRPSRRCSRRRARGVSPSYSMAEIGSIGTPRVGPPPSTTCICSPTRSWRCRASLLPVTGRRASAGCTSRRSSRAVPS